MNKVKNINKLDLLVILTSMLLVIGLILTAMLFTKEIYGSCKGIQPGIFVKCIDGKWIDLDEK